MPHSLFKLPQITYIDRQTGREEIEAVYGEASIAFLYGPHILAKIFGRPLSFLINHFAIVSKSYGALMRRPSSKKAIKPFIERFGLDPSEFATQEFTSFDDFFSRKLKPSARPISSESAIIPADGRYWVCPCIEEAQGLLVKGKSYSLASLLRDPLLAKRYTKGSLVMARLCPTDYHRFHFPADGLAGPSEVVQGPLHSVNPIAVRKRPSIYAENKRSICHLFSKEFGEILIVEVGATSVGSIHQTYRSGSEVNKGEEKGYFSFGGSAMVLLFEPGRLQLCDDLVRNSAHYIETLCKMGQPLGTAR